eukprot:CAMPEP_0201531454 /NCGR_PEP_ID=MMETSP0161_2-20130828/47660_1 /ASSEMBLY_ACC=CAM_ASM_000251 /TAXON_ID=180227 /ORGANISM="Neoparamoeba aestuarina, Strain SoJaBio B1-5/56/2" /LENGTH=579 /DNA_ID=CAMNT_0047934371 /DNA_START=171 /DNA_END=1907 /DNA_ORIENTATION=-
MMNQEIDLNLTLSLGESVNVGMGGGEPEREKEREWTEEEIQKIVIIQRAIKRYLERFEKKIDRRRTRDAIAMELYETEKSYGKSLNSIINRYYGPMEENKFLSKNSLNTIFMNVTQIFELNLEMTSKLQLKIGEWGKYSTIGDIFLYMTPYLALYKDYCGGYHHSISKLEEKRDAYPKLSQFLDQNFMETGVQLASLLIQPIQRIPRYKLLLEQMLKNTEEDHKDHELVAKALEGIEGVATYVNESVRERQSMEKILELKKKLTGDVPNLFLVEKRIFHIEGVLGKVCRKTTKNRTFFLFSDILIYAVKMENSPIAEQYKFHRAIDLFKASIIDVPDKPGMEHGFQLLSKTKSFTLLAENFIDKQKWMGAIRTVINDYRERHGDCSTSGVGGTQDDEDDGSAPAPVWIPDGDAKTCMLCPVKFTTFNRRHHCRRCGKLVCGACSGKSYHLENLGKTARVCDNCYTELSGEEKERDKSMASFPNDSKKDKSKRQTTSVTGLSFFGKKKRDDDDDSPDSPPPSPRPPPLAPPGMSNNTNPGASPPPGAPPPPPPPPAKRNKPGPVRNTSFPSNAPPSRPPP